MMVDAQDIPWYVQTLGQWVIALPLIRWAGLRAIDERVDAKLEPIQAKLDKLMGHVEYMRGRMDNRRVDDDDR
jgi:hypothetical protein